MSEDEIRHDERLRLANLLEDNALTITGFASSPSSVLGTVILLLRLPGGSGATAGGHGGFR